MISEIEIESESVLKNLIDPDDSASNVSEVVS